MKNLLSRELRIVNGQSSMITQSTLNKKTKKPPCFTARRLHIFAS